MNKEIKKNRWEEDTMILVSRKTRAKLKLKAALKGQTLKQLLEDFSGEEKTIYLPPIQS